MYIDSVIIVSLTVGCLAFFLLVAVFVAIFQRELGTKVTKHREKLEEGEVSEMERLTPMPDEAQVEYTTETVQPDSKTPAAGYPHAQVNRLLAASGLADTLVSAAQRKMHFYQNHCSV